MLIGILGKFVGPLGLAALVAGLVGYRALLVHQRDAARAQVQTLEEQKAGLAQANVSMQQAIARQNQAIDELRTKAAEAVKAAHAREADAAARGASDLKAELARAAQIAQSP